MRDYNERLLDILEAIENIDKYASRGHEAFKNDELIQTWIVHHLQKLQVLFLIVSEKNIRKSPGQKLLE